jgi:Chaperone of endosialidase
VRASECRCKQKTIASPEEAQAKKGKLIMKARNKNTFTTMLVALLCFAFSPQTRAACGSPDQGCPRGNLAEGTGALLSLTNGTYNTAIGYLSLRSNTEGGFNTSAGAGALFSNNSGRNTATGAAALLSNTTGPANTANGALALLSNTEGGYNTAVGDRALQSHTAGDRNTAIGASALFDDTTGTNNTAIGAAALLNNATGSYNTALGDDALGANTIGGENTAIGRATLFNNTSANGNTAVGVGALFNNSTGGVNTALGAQAGLAITTASDVICIRSYGENVSHSCYIGNIWNEPGGSQAVYVNSAGKLGAQVSSRRFKQDIKPMGKASQALFSLKPASFHYKKQIDPAGISQFGLVAEDVEKVNPDLVVRDKKGKPYSVRYDQVNAMLLNEFLKEHRKVQELERTIAQRENKFSEQEKQIAALRSGLQKVSAQLEMIKPAPQVAVKNPKDFGTTTDNPRKEEP